MRPILICTRVINRPKTTAKTIEHLLKHTDRSKFDYVIVDQNSNDETQEVLRKYEKDIDTVIRNDFNTGPTFSINQAMALLSPGQHYLSVDADTFVAVNSWIDMMLKLAEYTDIGGIAGRRPSYWIDTPEQQHKEFFNTFVYGEKRKDVWCEFVTNGLIIGPFTMVTARAIERIGYNNEALCIDDIDFYARVHGAGFKNCYIPDCVCFQHHSDEKQDHPQYGAYGAIKANQVREWQKVLPRYQVGRDLYKGTRFLPQTIWDPIYKAGSDKMWDYFRRYNNE